MNGNENTMTNWVVKEDVDDDDHDVCTDSISIGVCSSEEDSMNSVCTSSLSELAEEASSSTSSLSTSSSSLHSNGPLYELSELMNHLPLKKGLSMFFQGKAQSFSSLASVQSIEDIPKKERPNYRKKMKSCKSYGGGLDGHNRISSYTPKATISKKAARGPNFVSVITRRGSFLGGGSKPSSSFAVHKNF